MRLACILAFAIWFNLQAESVFSQTTVVSIRANQTSVENVLRAIEKQSGRYCVYNSKLINADRMVDIDLENCSIEEALDKLFKGTKVKYEINERHIIISPASTSIQQIKKISGHVLDDKGESIIGANIIVKGKPGQGAITNINGNFTIELPQGDVTLVVSYIGYTTQEVKVGNKSTLKIILKEDSETLDEVVVVGFSTQKKANVTGAVAQVSMDKALGDRPVTSLGAALQGAMSGFNASSGAQPGAGNTFNIRGLESINGGAPLILVDNVVFNDLYLLNPADIESVSILKDASSAAIYGARASFGVVLITTKKAKKNERLSINYNNNFAVSKVNNLLELASPIEMISTLQAGGYTSVWSGQNIETWMKLLNEYKANPSLYPKGWTEVNGTKYFLRENNIIKDMFENSWKQTHNISAQGGSEKIKYRLSAAYTKQDGILVTDKDAFTRYNISSHVSGDITKWLTTSLDFNYSRGEKSFPITDGSSELRIWPTNTPSYHPVGNLPYGNDGAEYPVMTPENIIRLTNAENTATDNTRVLSRTNVKIIKGLEAVLEYSYQVGNSDYEAYYNLFEVHQGLAESIKPSTAKTPFTRHTSSTRYSTLNAFATYNATFGNDHNVSAIAGYNQEENHYRYLYGQAYNMISNELPSLSGSTGETPSKTSDAYTDYGLRSGFFRASYNYAQKYFLEANGRYDLSSKFPKDYRSGFFPSVSVGWGIHNEKFMEDTRNVLSNLKLRGSYGTLGNQNIGAYGYFASMGVATANWISEGMRPTTLTPPGMVRANYTWEKVTTVNGGLDFGFINNRLTGTLDVYRRDTKGMLGPGEDLPAVGGATALQQNAADMKTIGFEFGLNWRDQIGEINYGIGFNIYDSKSKITRYKNENKLLSSYYVGQEIGEIWGYLTDGFYTADDFDVNGALKEGVVSINGVTSHVGDIKYKNLRDDENYINSITSGDNTFDNPGDRVVIGNNRARWQYGANGFVQWKGFNFSFILQGVGKRDAWIGGDINFPMASQYGTLYKHQVGQIWTEDNPNAFYGRIYENAGSSQGANQRTCDKFLYNAAYMRIKNLTLSYTFPIQLIQKMYLKGLKVFISGEDLFTFDHLPAGIDPENLGWNYPHASTVSFGMNFTL